MANIINSARYLTIIGDILFALWILYNGIDEGFGNIGSVQSIALISLIFLLILNILLLIIKKK